MEASRARTRNREADGSRRRVLSRAVVCAARAAHRRRVQTRPRAPLCVPRRVADRRDRRPARGVRRSHARRGKGRNHDLASHRRGAIVLPPPGAARHAYRQPRSRARAAAAATHTAADALARRGGTADRSRRGNDAALAPRPRARRASLRRGAPRQRGRRARALGRRPRAASRPLHRQGLEGARRPGRARGGRSAPPVSRARPPTPRPAPPPGALPQREGRCR